MIVFFDGQYMPAERALVPISDRSFLYGDGLFETVPVFHGQPFRWQSHWERFQHGAEFLGIEIPCSKEAAAEALDTLGTRNQLKKGLARLTLSRGAGPRGYSSRGAQTPRLAITLHPLPEHLEQELVRWDVVTSTQVIPTASRLAAFKTANKLAAVLARREAEAAGADEALVLNCEGRVAEAGAANLFWIEKDHVFTPPLSEGGLNGVTRAIVKELCRSAKVGCEERPVHASELGNAQGVFLSLSSWGVVEVARLDGRELPSAPRVRELWQRYWALVRAECPPARGGDSSASADSP